MQRMSADMQSVATAVTSINGNMNEISAAVQQAAGAVDATKSAAKVLAR